MVYDKETQIRNYIDVEIKCQNLRKYPAKRFNEQMKIIAIAPIYEASPHCLSKVLIYKA